MKKRTAIEHYAYVRSRCTVTESGCWVWPGSRSVNGYGQTHFEGRHWRLHRWMFSFAVRPIPPGMNVLHKCDNRACCNPDHLWLGTQRENVQDCIDKNRHPQLVKTHCPRGHEYTPENTLHLAGRMVGKRNCKACSRISSRLRAGWTLEQAKSLPRTPPGHRPVAGTFKQSKVHTD